MFVWHVLSLHDVNWLTRDMQSNYKNRYEWRKTTRDEIFFHFFLFLSVFSLSSTTSIQIKSNLHSNLHFTSFFALISAHDEQRRKFYFRFREFFFIQKKTSNVNEKMITSKKIHHFSKTNTNEKKRLNWILNVKWKWIEKSSIDSWTILTKNFRI